MPHVRVRQITDRPMSSAMLVETAGISDHRNQSRRNNVERLRRYIEVRGDAVAPGRGLVVCQQAVEAALKAGALPSNIEIAHFNDITGLNAWSNIASLTAIGRTEPSPRSVERLARALFGITPVEVAPDDKGNVSYPRVARGIRMRDGTGRKVEGNQHPDARVEALRWAICEAELIQAIGRGRGVNRSADNPLQIDTLTNVVLPIEVDETTTWDRIQPTLAETMRARGAVPISYRDMAAAYPDLFETARAAETALQRENPTQTSIERFLIDVCVGFLSVTYRRTGSRGPGARLLYDARRVDPVAWLRERIGPVTILGEGAPVAEEPGEAVDAPTPQPAAADAPEPTLAAPNIPAPDPGPVVDEPIAATQSAIADPAGVPDTPEADSPPITSEQPPLATAPVAGVLAVWARDCAALRALPPPPGFTRWRWRRVGDEAGMFVDRWGAEAIRLALQLHFG
jgi:putative DNA primase/helicase